mmetsp:Transcript_41095/g.34642  ORF Transcript_41095/g.34642 Transcript_41095/m.34642 type:complete len:86 (+) Transcript_41095:628-885(+)
MTICSPAPSLSPSLHRCLKSKRTVNVVRTWGERGQIVTTCPGSWVQVKQEGRKKTIGRYSKYLLHTDTRNREGSTHRDFEAWLVL